MASKQISLGTILKTDDDSNGSFDTMTLVRSITPPPRQRELIDGLVLSDTFDVPLPGIEQSSQMVFEQLWHPNDSEHEKMDTLFASKASFDVQIVTPHTTPVTDEMTVKCVGLEPAALETGGVYARTVTLQRQGAITRT